MIWMASAALTSPVGSTVRAEMRCAAENVSQTSMMTDIQPVLEVFKPEEFSLWPVAWSKRFGYLPLRSPLESIEVSTAVMGIAEANEVDHERRSSAASRRSARGLPAQRAHHGAALRARRAASHRQRDGHALMPAPTTPSRSPPPMPAHLTSSLALGPTERTGGFPASTARTAGSNRK